MLAWAYVKAVSRKIQRRIGFTIFSIAIRKLTNEIGPVSSLGPRFPKILDKRNAMNALPG